MQYLLALYSEESGWSQMTPEQQQQGIAALYRLHGSTEIRRSSKELQPLASKLKRNHPTHHQRENSGSRRTLR